MAVPTGGTLAVNVPIAGGTATWSRPAPACSTWAHLNTYTGMTTINAGTVQLGVPSAIDSGNGLTLNGSEAVLDVAGNGQTLGRWRSRPAASSTAAWRPAA